MTTTKQAANRAGIGVSTVRHYAREWSDYLSPSATPEAGETRQYTEDDIAVFRTIKTLRDQGANTEDIKAALDAGDRYEPLTPPPTEADIPQEANQAENRPDRALATVELLERFVKPYQDRIDALEAKLDQAQEARISAETEAARLAGKLEAIENRRPWWKFWGE